MAINSSRRSDVYMRQCTKARIGTEDGLSHSSMKSDTNKTIFIQGYRFEYVI